MRVCFGRELFDSVNLAAIVSKLDWDVAVCSSRWGGPRQLRKFYDLKLFYETMCKGQKLDEKKALGGARRGHLRAMRKSGMCGPCACHVMRCHGMRCEGMRCDANRCDAMRWAGRGRMWGGGGEDEREFEVPHLLFLQWGCVADAAAFSNIWQCRSLMGLLMRFMVPLKSDGQGSEMGPPFLVPSVSAHL